MSHGVAGAAFVEALLTCEEDLPALYAEALKADVFARAEGMEGRAAGAFALVGLAGELAVEVGILPFSAGEAMAAAVGAFTSWRGLQKGSAAPETDAILSALRGFVTKAEARFSPLGGDTVVRDRAGWWRGDDGERVHYLTGEALREACPGFDLSRILDAVDEAGWIAERDKGKRRKNIKVAGRALPLYALKIGEEA
ncbi:hypothetical protein [Pararhodospirillum photometricum]|uniref:Uncharacterized protein n=1 Tax=Pararhodospirillum photometricum DSM 122 TaxID=1150469 RepID=H6SM33_PARPM|nr:hypothetical protein [Pararhodospirillum photometricum]CCG09048.1 Putative uncharacterized protein [Pararhodospirillum photometricum DSM 122]